jgi:hypothetical protein
VFAYHLFPDSALPGLGCAHDPVDLYDGKPLFDEIYDKALLIHFPFPPTFMTGHGGVPDKALGLGRKLVSPGRGVLLGGLFFGLWKRLCVPTDCQEFVDLENLRHILNFPPSFHHFLDPPSCMSHFSIVAGDTPISLAIAE